MALELALFLGDVEFGQLVNLEPMVSGKAVESFSLYFRFMLGLVQLLVWRYG